MPAALLELPTTPLRIDPDSSIHIGARDYDLDAGPDVLYFGGTDVTAPLHLGHLYCFAVGRCLAECTGGRFIVSLNEIESGTNRSIPAPVAMRNARLIRTALEEAGFEVHSRLQDSELVYASVLLYTYLLNNQSRLVTSIYGKAVRTSDILGICTMILAPAFFAGKHGKVCAVYGYDEVRHVEFIYELYGDPKFAEWVREHCKRELPAFTYVLTPLLASSTPGFKMSKSRGHEAVPWGSAPPGKDQQYAEMFARLYEFAKLRAPHLAGSAAGRLIARHGRG